MEQRIETSRTPCPACGCSEFAFYKDSDDGTNRAVVDRSIIPTCMIDDNIPRYDFLGELICVDSMCGHLVEVR